MLTEYDRPPGTGKSSTVVNLVGALCSHRGAVPSRGSQRVPARLLLCAPSNAAVDELVRRLKDGVRSMDGEAFSPHVVRIGADSSISSSVRDVFIDELVDKQLNTTSADDGVTQEISNLRNELDSIKVARLDKQKELDALTSAARPDSERINKLESAQRALRRQNQETSIKLQEARDSMQARTRALDASKRNARMDILSSADVICTTLSGSGHDYMSSLPDFNTVIIDEAAQSVELSCLIPLRYGCQQCIMVGGQSLELYR